MACQVYEPDKKVNPYTGEPMKEEFAWQGEVQSQ
jgi:hypothetical protein